MAGAGPKCFVFYDYRIQAVHGADPPVKWRGFLFVYITRVATSKGALVKTIEKFGVSVRVDGRLIDGSFVRLIVLAGVYFGNIKGSTHEYLFMSTSTRTGRFVELFDGSTMFIN